MQTEPKYPLREHLDESDLDDMTAWLDAVYSPEQLAYEVWQTSTREYAARCLDYPLQQPATGYTHIEALELAIKWVRDQCWMNLRQWLDWAKRDKNIPPRDETIWTRRMNDRIIPGTTAAKKRAEERHAEWIKSRGVER